MSSIWRICTFKLFHMYCLGEPSNLCIYFVIIIIIPFLYISESINVFIYLVPYRPIEPGALYVFVYVIVYNYVNVCTSHNNKPFTYLYLYWMSSGSYLACGRIYNNFKNQCDRSLYWKENKHTILFITSKHRTACFPCVYRQTLG